MTFADIPIGGKIYTENFITMIKLTKEGLCCSDTTTIMCFSDKENTGDKVWQNNGCNLYQFSTVNQRIREIDNDFIRDYAGNKARSAWRLRNLDGVEEHFVLNEIETQTSVRNIKNNFAPSYIEKVYGWLPSIHDVVNPWWKEYVKDFTYRRFTNIQLWFREGMGRSEVFYYNCADGEIKSGPAYVERRVRPLYQMKTDTEVLLKRERDSLYEIIYTPSHDMSISENKFNSFLTL